LEVHEEERQYEEGTGYPGCDVLTHLSAAFCGKVRNSLVVGTDLSADRVTVHRVINALHHWHGVGSAARASTNEHSHAQHYGYCEIAFHGVVLPVELSDPL
jgi:hypothetical protein